MSVPIDLAAVRAIKTDDNRAWSPVQALRHAISEIEAGRLKADRALVILSYPREDDPEVRRHVYLAANMSDEQQVSTAAYALRDLMEK